MNSSRSMGAVKRLTAWHKKRQHSAGCAARGDEAGDTLIEVLMTMIVLGMSGVALLGAFAMAIGASSDYRTVASLNTVLASASANAISKIQQQDNSLYISCATPSTYNASVGTTSGFTVTVTDVEYLNGSTFSSVCSTGLTTPQQITIMATKDSGGISGTSTFVVDDRSHMMSTSSVLTFSPTPSTASTENSVVLTVTVTGAPGAGNPLGTMQIMYNGVNKCQDLTATASGAYSAIFTCSVPNGTFPYHSSGVGNTYSLTGVYTPDPTTSSNAAYAYSTSTSPSVNFTVTGT